MKKLLSTFLMAFSMAVLVNGQFTKIGGGLTYGTGFHYNNVTSPDFEANFHKGPNLGIFVTGIYELKLPVHIAPSFTYFFPRTNKDTQVTSNPQKTRVSGMMFDLNGHYVFNSLDRFEFFGLAGLNITFAKIKWLNTTSGDSDNAIGLNIGAGTYMKLTEQLDLYGQVKYIVSKYDRLVINAGLLLNVDWLKKNESSGL
jgi:outer membrane immunogenic protein